MSFSFYPAHECECLMVIYLIVLSLQPYLHSTTVEHVPFEIDVEEDTYREIVEVPVEKVVQKVVEIPYPVEKIVQVHNSL